MIQFLRQTIRSLTGLRAGESPTESSAKPGVEATDFYAQLFEQSPIAMARLSPEGRLKAINARLAEELGILATVDLGRNHYLLAEWMDDPDQIVRFNRELQKITQPPVARATAAGSVDDLVEEEGAGLSELSLKTEPRRNFKFYLHPLTIGGEAGVEAVIYLIEVTVYKNLELQLLHAGKMQAIGQLAGGIAHDFNNLLTAMVGFGDLLLQRHGPGDESFGDLMQIKQNANRAAELVRQLLAFSRQQTLRPTVLDLSQQLPMVMQLLQRLIGQTIELRLMHSPGLGLVKVDSGQMEQVIVNLVVNARDSMPHGGVITIRASNVTIETPIKFAHETMPPGEFVQLDVIDNGSGIAEQHIERIFDPFFTTKPVGSGTGLGLSTVWGIVRQTGGFVTVVSEIGRGTSFTIFLPRYLGKERSETPAPPQPVAAPVQGKGRILLVEDEVAVRAFAARTLKNHGYEVYDAENGESALNVLESLKTPPDLIITDAVMPGMNGPALIHRVRQTYPSIRVLCISGHSDEALRKQLNEFSDVKFLAKPFSLTELVREVQECLKR
ncbi:MAG: response regulator [Alphaproteobacteria bacterium]|nr:response regulator [Alphaproteobacteria bacterium]